MTFRKEKKFRLSQFESLALRSKLVHLGMNQIHVDRTITSVYMDTADMRMFFETEDGTLPRKKIRLRWYNEERDISLETKISSLEGRFKIRQPFNEQKFLDPISSYSHFDKDYGFLKPKLTVKYQRAYYCYEGMRITFDRDISYLSPMTITQISRADREVVVEVKTAVDCGDDFISKFFPFSTSRFSKYSRGVLALQNLN